MQQRGGAAYDERLIAARPNRPRQQLRGAEARAAARNMGSQRDMGPQDMYFEPTQEEMFFEPPPMPDTRGMDPMAARDAVRAANAAQRQMMSRARSSGGQMAGAPPGMGSMR